MRRSFTLLLSFSVFLAIRASHAETITIDGQTYEDAEIAEVGESGVYYKTTAGSFVVLPWSELTEFQAAILKSRYKEPMENVRLGAIWVEGTVFENHRDGTVVQVSLDLGGEDEDASSPKIMSELPYKYGAELAKGLVMVKDLKDSAVKKPGDPVSGVFFKQNTTYTYEMGGFNLIKEIPSITQAKPEWARVREWTNREGNKILAKVIAVKEEKCLFEQEGKTFPYEIASLSEADQALVATFVKRTTEIPLL